MNWMGMHLHLCLGLGLGLTNELDGYASTPLVGIGISAWQIGHVRVL